MTSLSIRPLLAGAAIAAAVSLAPVAGALAQVRCSTDGISWHCADLGPVAASIIGPGWGYAYGGAYDQIPNDYPGPAPVHNDRY